MGNQPRRTTLVLLAASLAATCFLNYWQYSRDFYALGPAAETGGWMTVVLGTASAPEQYRVGVVDTAYWMSRHLHMGMRHAFGLLDLISVSVAALLLYGLLERSAAYRKATAAARWFGSMAFVMLVEFYLIWLLWYQRPETLPTALFAALFLWLWTHKSNWLDKNASGRLLTTGLILLISLAQGFVRADVACLLNAGVFLSCLTRTGKNLALPRTAALLSSLGGGLLAVAVQAYMMKVAFPHTTYGPRPVFELGLNISEPIRWVPFALFILPYAWTLMQVMRRRFAGSAADLALVAGSLLFGALWAAVGKIDEVRIFLPIAMALIPLTVQTAIRRLDLEP